MLSSVGCFVRQQSSRLREVSKNISLSEKLDCNQFLMRFGLILSSLKIQKGFWVCFFRELRVSHRRAGLVLQRILQGICTNYDKLLCCYLSSLQVLPFTYDWLLDSFFAPLLHYLLIPSPFCAQLCQQRSYKSELLLPVLASWKQIPPTLLCSWEVGIIGLFQPLAC